MPIASRVLPCLSGHAYSLFARPLAAVIIGWGATVHGGAVLASQESINAVAKLLEQGKATQAARQAESYLKQNPSDVQMRFLQGVIAAQLKQNQQAIKIFIALTKEYPNLPEPYNNLAVLYAAEGQERKASEVLEQAIRTNPSYATAHENLGDLYAGMASAAYSKALQLDDKRKAIQPKLALITQILPKHEEGSKPAVADSAVVAATSKTVAAPAASANAAAVSSSAKAVPGLKSATVSAAVTAAKEIKASDVKTVGIKTADAKATVPQEPVAAPAPAKTVEVRMLEPKPAAAVKSAAAAVVADAPERNTMKEKTAEVAAKDAAVAEVKSAVKAWAAAWQSQDVDRYLNAYSGDFKPADGSSLAKWKETRRERIVGKSGISVTLHDLQVSVDGDKATARFRQSYVAGALNTRMKKTLKLQREKGLWHITSEGA